MTELEQRPVGNTGLAVTLLGFGALEIGRDWGLGDAARRQRPAEADACTVLHAALDLGITLIDTASAYHRSEERIGRCLAGERERYVLATKCGEHNAGPTTPIARITKPAGSTGRYSQSMPIFFASSPYSTRDVFCETPNPNDTA